MGKRKIGEIYNRPIIEGDINLKTSSEIHKSELSVPQSGGGDAPSQPSGGNMEYWDVTADPDGASEISPFLLLLKYTRNELQYIQSIVSIRSSGVTPIAVAFDRTVKVANSNKEVVTVGEYFQQMGFPEFSSVGWVQITEEQFYNLEA